MTRKQLILKLLNFLHNNEFTGRYEMLGIGDKLPSFKVTGVKPGFNFHEENGVSAFEEVTEASFEGKWKVIFFYPKDFTFVCPTEIAEFARLASDFEDRDAVVLGGSTDNEFVKLAWRRDHKDLDKLPIWSFADTNGSLVDGLGVRSPDGVAYRYTFVVDPDNTIQHVYATNLNVGRALRTRCAFSTLCRPMSFAHATAKSVARRSRLLNSPRLFETRRVKTRLCFI